MQQTSNSRASLDRASSQTMLHGQEHHEWTMDQWERVVQSEESRFIFQQVDVQVSLCRLSGELLLYVKQQKIHKPVRMILCFEEYYHGRLWEWWLW